LKILDRKLVLSKKPYGPKVETMLASIIEISAVREDPKKMTYFVQYSQKPFNINKALRASPEEIKKMSTDQMMARVKRYVSNNLGIFSSIRRVHSRHTTLVSAKKSVSDLLRKFQSR
jgi:hypothetical protein